MYNMKIKYQRDISCPMHLQHIYPYKKYEKLCYLKQINDEQIINKANYILRFLFQK